MTKDSFIEQDYICFLLYLVHTFLCNWI